MRSEYLIGGVIFIALAGGVILYLGSDSGLIAPGQPSAAMAGEGGSATTSEAGEAAPAPGAGAASGSPSSPSFLSAAAKAARYDKAPELAGIEGYINTNGKQIRIADYVGKKVVLIDIWTYSCINCQRTLPYVKSWYDKYAGEGLEIIGVHTPEFAFEKKLSNVENAVKEDGIRYPVVLDNQYATWNAFGNRYWPRKYLIDIDGYIVYDHAGEGDYDAAEKAIQKALAERAARLGLGAMPEKEIGVAGMPAEASTAGVGSPETYFGALRNEYLGNGEKGKAGVQTLSIPEETKINTLYLGGEWNFTDEYAQNRQKGARIVYPYRSRSVYFVASSDTPVTVKVTRDGGQPLGDLRGADVNANGEARVGADRLYKLVEGAEPGAHTLEIEVEGSGLKAYTFTFG